MTVNNANHPRPAASTCRAGAFGIAVGLLAALGGAHAAPASAVAVGIAQSVPVSPLDPAKRTPARIEVADIDPSTAEASVAQALAAAELTITRERKGQSVTDDVRPAILALRVLGPVDAVVAPLAPRATGTTTAFEAELATQPRALRPAELISAIDPTWVVARVTRIHQWTQAGGARREVIDLGPAATPPPRAEGRAS